VAVNAGVEVKTRVGVRVGSLCVDVTDTLVGVLTNTTVGVATGEDNGMAYSHRYAQ